MRGQQARTCSRRAGKGTTRSDGAILRNPEETACSVTFAPSSAIRERSPRGDASGAKGRKWPFGRMNMIRTLCLSLVQRCSHASAASCAADKIVRIASTR
jgi:hypothetical protein